MRHINAYLMTLSVGRVAQVASRYS